MPRTALGFQIGAVAICGLPPLNGFVSELLIYLGLFRALDPAGGLTFVGAAFGIPALAVIGALALACFVKVYGAVFLGTPRSEHAAHAREASTPMLASMAVLVGCCLLIGVAPLLVAPVLTGAVNAWVPGVEESESTLTSLVPLDWISVMSLFLLGGLVVTGTVLWWLLYRSRVDAAPTWGCGYAAPTRRMQYTSSSFAQMLVGLFSWALRPNRHAPTDANLFPQSATFYSDVPDAVLDRGILPTFRFCARLFSWFRVFQHASIQIRILYLVLTLIALLLLR
jgi:hydrogenase-4 component B